MPSTRELLARGDARIDVRVDGAAGHPAVVLLPSSLRGSLDFDPLAERLAAGGLRVLRPQPRGIGGSRGPMDGLDLNELAADVALAIEQLGDGRAVVAGHAFGHFVARVADLRHPARVRGVAVLAGAAREFPAGIAETLAVASDPTRPPAERLAALRRGFFAPGHDPRPWLDGWHPELRETYRRAGRTPPKDQWWPVTNAPILDLQAEHDPWRPPATRDELKAVLGDRVSVQLIRDASHALVPEQPAAVADALLDWIATLPA